MKKNEINSYNLLNKAIGRLGEIKADLPNGIEEENYKTLLDEIKSIVDKALEEFTKKSRTKEEILADIKEMVSEEDVLVVLAEMISEDYELHTDIDDLFNYPSDLVDAMYRNSIDSYDVYYGSYFMWCCDTLYCYRDKSEYYSDLIDWDADGDVLSEIKRNTDTFRGHFDELDELLDELKECEE